MRAAASATPIADKAATAADSSGSSPPAGTIGDAPRVDARLPEQLVRGEEVRVPGRSGRGGEDRVRVGHHEPLRLGNPANGAVDRRPGISTVPCPARTIAG